MDGDYGIKAYILDSNFIFMVCLFVCVMGRPPQIEFGPGNHKVICKICLENAQNLGFQKQINNIFVPEWH